MSPEPEAGRRSRIENWAAKHRKIITPETFAGYLDGAQVAAELMNIFRETPEFGRSLAIRLVNYLNEETTGPCTLVGAGGEAVVFYDEAHQQVIKLFSAACRAKFGWVFEMRGNEPVSVRPGELSEALLRFSYFEELFGTGLELDLLGQDAQFLLLRQPFIAGQHPTFDELRSWMRNRGWTQVYPETDAFVIREQTWQQGPFLATDVRPENALISTYDGQLRAIDFILHRLPG